MSCQFDDLLCGEIGEEPCAEIGRVYEADRDRDQQQKASQPADQRSVALFPLRHLRKIHRALRSAIKETRSANFGSWPRPSSRVPDAWLTNSRTRMRASSGSWRR